MRQRRTGTITAFTLVEMLVVLGIIVILISILLPVIANIRKSAYTAATQQQLQRISAAITHYYNDFGAYPGPLKNEQLDPPTIAFPTINGLTKLTSSENLVLGLLGGLQIGTGNTVTYNSAFVGKGPMKLNFAYPQQYPPYLNYSASELSSGLIDTSGSTDTVVPEFMDQFPTPSPILYVRAKAGAPIPNPPSGAIVSQDNSMQYNVKHLLDYAPNFLTGPPTATDFPAPSTNGSEPAWSVYFENPSLLGNPKGKDSYILIAAGADGLYGTKDDIISTP